MSKLTDALGNMHDAVTQSSIELDQLRELCRQQYAALKLAKFMAVETKRPLTEETIDNAIAKYEALTK